MLEEFRHIQAFRVGFRDIDMMQHVNHSAYIRWAEAHRSDYFIENFHDSLNGQRGMILVKIEFAYERQLSLREQVRMGCRVSRVGNRSFDFTYAIWSDDAQALCASGITTVVAYDYPAATSIIVPQAWRAAIKGYESQPVAGLEELLTDQKI